MFDNHLILKQGDLEVAIPNLWLSAIIIALGIVSYVGVLRRGEVWSFFHSFWLFSLVIPTCFSGLYASSLRNKETIGGVIEGLMPWTDRAFFLSCIGGLGAFAGHFWAVHRCSGRPFILKTLNRVKISLEIFEGKKVIFGGLIFFALVFLGVLAYLFGLNTLLTFGLRGAFLGYGSDGVLRPVYNFLFSGLIPFAFILVTLAFRRYRSVWPYLGLFLLIAVGAMAGTRGAVLWPLVTGILIWIIVARSKILLILGALVSPFVLLAAIFLGQLRSGDADISHTIDVASYNLKYGNEFSDVRDLGWILSGWDGEYRMGRTYAAASLSFVPSEYLPWRRYNGMVWQMTGPLGLMDSGHAGLRPGVFGEAYLNFGLFGCVVMGFFLGCFSTRLDLNLLIIGSDRNLRIGYVCAAHLIWVLAYMFSNTSGFFAFYSLVLCYFLCFLTSWVLGLRRSPQVVNGNRGRDDGRVAFQKS